MKSPAGHVLLSFVVGALTTATVSSQTLGPKPSAVQHVTAQTSTAAAPGNSATRVLLQVDVTPNPNIHVYAQGAKEFTPVSLVVTAAPGVTLGKPEYPKSDLALAPGADATPAYRKTFRITQPVTLAAAKQPVEISGVLNYQACDDRLCYPVASLPVTWTIPAR
jgi:DsbC/DsbD-like thiol-disulfide interchange protein